MRLALAVLAFQAGWFACVLGAESDLPWLGPAVVAALALAFVARSQRRGWALASLALAAALGFALDSALALTGLIRFPHVGNPQLSPLWMTALWVNFALFVPVGLRRLYGRWALAAALGAAGGPAAYWAGQRLGALEWSTPQAVGAVAVEWAAATPAIVWLSRQTDSGRRME